MNYRSVVVFGQAVVVSDPDEKTRVLKGMTDHLIPGRWPTIRHPNPQELKKTLVLAIAIEEASAKIRVGPPLDDEEDYALDIWAGVLPLAVTASAPLPDPRLPREYPAASSRDQLHRPATSVSFPPLAKGGFGGVGRDRATTQKSSGQRGLVRDQATTRPSFHGPSLALADGASRPHDLAK